MNNAVSSQSVPTLEQFYSVPRDHFVYFWNKETMDQFWNNLFWLQLRPANNKMNSVSAPELNLYIILQQTQIGALNAV